MQRDQDVMKQNQDQRVKPIMQGENQQRNQPQKCPRCESLNTKFCYYNNYSLSQPRYFCKTCRRYWTHGGTLRNVPVGGGCRKGKRPKTSSSSSTTNSSSSSSEISQSQTSASSTQNMVLAGTNSVSNMSLGLRAKESMNLVSNAPGVTSLGTYSYSTGGGGFLMNSLTAIQSLNNQPAQSFAPNHQSMNLVGENFGGGISNLSLLHGFNAAIPFGSQQIQQQGQLYHMGSRENKSSTGEHPFYAAATSHHQQNWHQAAGFMSSSQTNPTALSDTALWSVSTSTTTGNTANAGGSFALNPTAQWHNDLPGYAPPP